jgi:hypothetical protein
MQDYYYSGISHKWDKCSEDHQDDALVSPEAEAIPTTSAPGTLKQKLRVSTHGVALIEPAVNRHNTGHTT